MKKSSLLLIIFSAITAVVTAQRQNIDSLKQQLEIEKTDTGRINLYSSIQSHYNYANADSAVVYANHALHAVRRLKINLLEANYYSGLSYSLYLSGNYIASMQAALSGLSIAEEPGATQKSIPPKYRYLAAGTDMQTAPDNHIHQYVVARLRYMVGFVYIATDQPHKAIEHLIIAAKTFKNINIQAWVKFALSNLSMAYAYAGKYKEGLETGLSAYELSKEQKSNKGYVECYIANNYAGLKDTALAKKWFYAAILTGKTEQNDRGLAHIGLSQIFLASRNIDSALWHAHMALYLAESQKFKKFVLAADTMLVNIHEAIGNTDSAYFYLQRSVKLRNELFNSEKAQELTSIINADNQHKKEIEISKAAFNRKLQLYMFIAAFFLLLCIALFLWRNNRQRTKANRNLFKQKSELEDALKKLKSTQSQLIQSEKMASLGELTAGIAHEIQNPLNFVNNFSEVNMELVGEMKEELAIGNKQQATELANDLEQNLAKIHHHGKRADAIVKGMLQHSRASSGKKEPADINALADEYLRLSYHGLRAKDNSFTASVKTQFDGNIQKIFIVPQDVGRVLLNLISNAFYAVNEKKKHMDVFFEPTVEVSTKRVGNKIEIAVKDNGNGIPQKIIDKIYQPFFTTKPTGEGTGLGLSISYDIIKAHGGELKVETKEGEGAEFIIILPVIENL